MTKYVRGTHQAKPKITYRNGRWYRWPCSVFGAMGYATWEHCLQDTLVWLKARAAGHGVWECDVIARLQTMNPGAVVDINSRVERQLDGKWCVRGSGRVNSTLSEVLEILAPWGGWK